jgi:multidrug efflux pump subunit AcrA (membrane-fusion protein)
MKLTSDTPSVAEKSARSRLWDIAHELAEAAKVEQSSPAFFRKWLSGVMSATGTVATAVYEATPKGFRCLGQLGDLGTERDSAEVAEQRHRVRLNVIEKRKPIWIREPNLAADRITLVAPLADRSGGGGVVEAMLPTSLATQIRQRGCMAFVMQAIPFIDDFLLRERVRSLSRKQELCDEVLRFVGKIHASLDLDSTAYAVANEGRRLSQCDRVTVLRRLGRRYRVVAVSGQDRFDLRSPAIRKLTSFATAVAATGETYSSDGSDISSAPQLEHALADYLDDSFVKHVTVVPLTAKSEDSDSGDEGGPKRDRTIPFGVIVFERHNPTAAASGYEERLTFLAEYAAVAIANALEQQRIFLLPMWRKIGRLNAALFAPESRFKTISVLVLVATLIASLIFVPADFTLHAKGSFQPVERRHVFVPHDGTVKKLHVEHGAHVEVGSPLVDLRNTDLEVATTEARGELSSAEEQLASIKRALHNEGSRLTVEEQVRLSGQRGELQQKIVSLEEKLKLLQAKQERLKIVSPIAGEVVTWNLERLLHDRPVQQGQTLLTVADTAHDWELELYLSEHYVGQLTRAQRESNDPLVVRFRPTSDPSREFLGTIKSIDSTAEVRGDHGNSVLVTVTVVANEMPQLKPGSEATANVLCGRRSLGYVWLHDLADFFQAKVLFRLY